MSQDSEAQHSNGISENEDNTQKSIPTNELENGQGSDVVLDQESNGESESELRLVAHNLFPLVSPRSQQLLWKLHEYLKTTECHDRFYNTAGKKMMHEWLDRTTEGMPRKEGQEMLTKIHPEPYSKALEEEYRQSHAAYIQVLRDRQYAKEKYGGAGAKYKFTGMF